MCGGRLIAADRQPVHEFLRSRGPRRALRCSRATGMAGNSYSAGMPGTHRYRHRRQSQVMDFTDRGCSSTRPMLQSLRLGRWIQPKHLPAAFATGLLSGAAFFVISNFGDGVCHTKLASTCIARTFSGLTTCFVNAIPFARGTFFGDVGFTVLFIGTMQLLASPLQNNASASTETVSIDA